MGTTRTKTAGTPDTDIGGSSEGIDRRRGADGGRLRLAPLLALSLGYFLVMLDVTVVTVAVPAIRRSLHADPAALQWIVDGYSAVFAGLLLSGGELGDRIGHRRVLLTGLGLFAAASIGCGLANSPTALIAARLAQGAGAALLVPASLALLAAAYPDRAVRARALGLWAGIAGVAFASGPVVGGVLVTASDWRAVFWLNPPLAALMVVLILRYVPVRAPMRVPVPVSAPLPMPAAAAAALQLPTRPDWAGRVLGLAGLLLLAAALNQAGVTGWAAPSTVVEFLVSGIALLLFVHVERRIEGHTGGRPSHFSHFSRLSRLSRRRQRDIAPLLAPSLFRRPGFASTAVIGVLLNLGYYGMLYLATLYFQVERGYSALGAGLALLPSACMAIAMAPVSGRVTARLGPHRPMAAALLLGAAGFLGWLAAGPHTPYPALLFALIATGLAVPLAVPAATAAVIEAAPADRAGVAAAVFNVARQVGNAVGVALFGSLAAGPGRLIPGLHLSAEISAAAFLTGVLLALRAARSARRVERRAADAPMPQHPSRHVPPPARVRCR